jgi:hypothetical protein
MLAMRWLGLTEMKLILLVLSATVLPFIWGFLANWLIQRLWPRVNAPVPAAVPDISAEPVTDFQI